MPLNPKLKLVENKSGGFSALAIIAVVAGLVVLAGGGFWAYQRYVVIPAPAGKPAEEKAAAPQPVAEKVDTSDWKTYRNEKYGFEVKYSPEFVYDEELVTLNWSSSRLEPDQFIKVRFGFPYRQVWGEDHSYYKAHLGVQIVVSQFRGTLEEFLTTVGVSREKASNTVVGGVGAVTIEDCGLGDDCYVRTYMVHNGFSMVFFNEYTSGRFDKDVGETMLSTFKLTQ